MALPVPASNRFRRGPRQMRLSARNEVVVLLVRVVVITIAILLLAVQEVVARMLLKIARGALPWNTRKRRDHCQVLRALLDTTTRNKRRLQRQHQLQPAIELCCCRPIENRW
jgi:hypothetical protein